MKDKTFEKNASTGDEKDDEQKEEIREMTPNSTTENAVPLERADNVEELKRRSVMISRILAASDQDLSDDGDDDDEQLARDRSSKSSSSNSQEKMQHSTGRMSMSNSNNESLRASYLESRREKIGQIRRKDSKDTKKSPENKKTTKELSVLSESGADHCGNAIAASAAAGEDLSLLRKSKISPPMSTMPTNLPKPLPLGENSHEFANAEKKNANEPPADDKSKDINGDEKEDLLLGAGEAKMSSSIQSQGRSALQQVPGAHSMPGINSSSNPNSSSNDIQTNIAHGNSTDVPSTNMGDDNVSNNENLPVPPPPQLIANQRYTAPGMFSLGNDMVRSNSNADADDLEQPRQGDAAAEDGSIEEDKDLLVEATLVSPDHQSSRAFGLPRRISNAGILVEATPVTMIGSNKLVLAGVCVLILIIVVLGVTLGLRKDDVSISEEDFFPSAMPSASPTEMFVPTLERVREAGVLRCGQEDYLPALFQFFESLQNPPPDLKELIDKTKKYNFDRALVSLTVVYHFLSCFENI